MTETMERTACALVAACSIAALSAQNPVAPVEARIPFAPAAVAGSDGLTHLGYELHLTNYYADGLPFVLESFELLGETTAARAVGAEPESLPPSFSPSRRRRELPLHGAVIRFP